MDLRKLAAAGDFSVPLSMGEVHVRTITSTWLNELESVVDKDISDIDFVRLALRRAGRTEKRPDSDVQDDSEPAAALAEAATEEGLQTVAGRLNKYNAWIFRNSKKPDALTKGEDESNAAFFRRIIRFQRDKSRELAKRLTGPLGETVNDMLKRNQNLFRQIDLQRDLFSSPRIEITPPLIDFRNPLLEIAERLEGRAERLEDHFSSQFEVIEQILKNTQEANVKVIGELQEGSKSAFRFSFGAIAIAISTAAPMRKIAGQSP